MIGNLPLIHDHSQLDSLGTKDVCWLGILRQLLTRRCSQDDGSWEGNTNSEASLGSIRCLPPPGLWYSVLASLQDPKGALVAHLDQTAERQLQDHALLEGDKVTNILQQKEPWSVVVTVAEVGHHQ